MNMNKTKQQDSSEEERPFGFSSWDNKEAVIKNCKKI